MMAHHPIRRSRASTAQDAGSGMDELRSQLRVLGQDTFGTGPPVELEVLHHIIEAGNRIRQSLLDGNDGSLLQDNFRHLDGFQTVISALRRFSLSYSQGQDDYDEVHILLMNALRIGFGVLTAALQEHKGNQRFFRHCVEGGGWFAIKEILQASLFSNGKSGRWWSGNLKDGCLGCLVAIALNDESMNTIFPRLKRSFATANVPPSKIESKTSELVVVQDGEDSTQDDTVKPATMLQLLLEKEIRPLAVVQNPDAILVLYQLWSLGEARSSSADSPLNVTSTSADIPRIIIYLANSSTRNLVALHGTGLLSWVLRSLLDHIKMEAATASELRVLAIALLRLGVGNVDDAHLLFRNARSSPVIAEILLVSLKSSRSPSYVHFDLSSSGFASIELPGIGRSFPPTSSSHGYSLSLWFQIVNFDPNAHTTIFGAFDSSQTCFVLVYLEKDSHNLILQTSVSSSRPSVRFKLIPFRERRWYHVVIAHRRPKATSSSRASLFVNGEFVEQVKSQYPATPPGIHSSNAPPSNKRDGVIQAFLGTPQDLAAHLGEGLVSTQWRLASANLFADVLSDDLVAVYYELGPRYTGNYQDCLGSFQTYQASAALNLRNESLHPGKEEKSDVVTAIRSKAGTLLPESNILLNISATVILDDDDRNNIDETHLLKFISKAAGKNLRNVTRGGRNALAINGAIPSINEALLRSIGFAVLTGNPAVVVPQALDDAAWRVGGCAAVGLALFDTAQGSDNIIRALNILFECVHQNWRNSEAMERENGFGVLSTLLNAKMIQSNNDPVNLQNSSLTNSNDQIRSSSTALRVLLEILKFVGYRIEKPEESVINNALAYRILLVDMDYWRSAEASVQKLYYDQFIVFGARSKFHVFNTKRLLRMRISKKWLEALKSETFTAETFEYFLTTFKTMLTKNISADSMRSLALYITYAIHKPRHVTSMPFRGKSTKLTTGPPSRRKTLGSPSSRPLTQQHEPAPQLTRLQVALKVLDLYADLLCQRDEFTNIHKFARTVTNKWLLHLLADDEPTVVILATKILARLLIVSGPSYVRKFVDKTGGIVIMQHRLRRWWNIPTLWPICFAILFGTDVGTIDFSHTFDLFGLLEVFVSESQVSVAYPAMLPVITSMLEQGLKAVTRDQSDPDSPLTERTNGKSPIYTIDLTTTAHRRQRSMTLEIGTSNTSTPKTTELRLVDSVSTLQTVTRFLADIQTKCSAFRDFTATSPYIQELFFVLFPIVVSANPVSPETELHSRDSALTFKGGDVIMRPLSANAVKIVPVVRTSNVESSHNLKPSRAPVPKRMSSYVLVNADQSQPGSSAPELRPVISPSTAKAALTLSSSIVEELLELIIAVFSDQIFSRKDFPGLGLFMRVPSGFQEHQAYFETFILRNTLSHLGNAIKLDQKLLWEPRVLTNLARFACHLREAIYEGWFINGAEDTLEFLANILEYVQLPSIASMKAIRLCSQIISSMRATLSRIILLRLSDLDEVTSAAEAVAFLDRLVYWQTVLLPAEDPHEDFLKLLCYLVYDRLTSSNEEIRMAAANLWRMLLIQKTDDITAILERANGAGNYSLSKGFTKILELDNETFLNWVDEHRDESEGLLFTALSKSWATFVAEENRKTQETARARIIKRREKLKLWVSESSTNEEILRRHETGTDHWRSNIYAAEHLKRQRALQDQQDSQVFNAATWTRMSRSLRRPCGLFDDMTAPKWQLDQTEGRNRMRMRLIPDIEAHLHDYQPKRRQSQGPIKLRRSLGTRVESQPAGDVPPLPSQVSIVVESTEATITSEAGSNLEDGGDVDDDFEIVDNPQDESELYEDKNRKVMRSLQRGDQVDHVHNVSRIVGLEAIEGLLILGKANLYLLDTLFQRSDGEVVNVWQAPQEERDPYLQMIAGRESEERSALKMKADYETRNWRWDDVLSISKRRFLFREVAIEVFFVDGRSYLLTTSTPALRNELYQKLLNKAANASSALDEDAWRIDAIQNPHVETQTFGSRFTSVFASNNFSPATKKWLKGEISNFHYLMLINTMAGRTFNDLTQYPVFPWVLADYTSEELDLTNPRVYRDLSKPMGCQNPNRQAEFKDRYQSFAEMGDEKSPPFHYGTHYSSAMIVTSYLIRLQPFVQSYLLLQGGNFDHPDRLFYSIEKAWSSASRDNMTDVRELTPEFYYLPEFLLNHNGYDFGVRQGDGGSIDTVLLPPWAKGDPKIFVAKNRKALESEHVSQNLHHWIDLIFGHKQRGEAALEATNVFHHLSYHGAKDLDTINDPVERLATIGIIHNFGQTPHQVFQRSHPPREDTKDTHRRLDTGAEGLTRLPFPLIEAHDRIASLHWSSKHDRLLCSGPFRINIGPAYDKYLEWGFIDGSVRFFSADSRKLIGLFEHVHQGQLTYVQFADSKTLVTAGSDCTISTWTVITDANTVDLQPKTCLYGHRCAVTMLAVSRSFSALLSASSDGQVLLWDLNRLELVRQLTIGVAVECARINNVTGVVMLCRASEVSLWTINGDLIVEQMVCVEGDDRITSCAFYEGHCNEYLERNLIFTGHKKGVVNIWDLTISEGAFVLDHVKRMHHLDHAGYNIGAMITSILPLVQKVYTGDDDGRVYEWDCIERQ